MSATLAFFIYFGSALIPVGYLVSTAFVGTRRRAMLRALGLHALVAGLIIGYTFWSRSAGYREWHWNIAWHIPTNLIFLCVYISRLTLHRYSPEQNEVGLLPEAEELARDLDAASLRYDGRSDSRDILGYEAATVRELVRAKITRTLPDPNLSFSSLLSNWGRPMRQNHTELVDRLIKFYPRVGLSVDSYIESDRDQNPK